MRLPLSEIAEADLDNIATYISRDSPRAAARLIDRLLDQCERVCQTPLGYPSAEHLRPGLRRSVCKPYIIFFIVDRNGVRIERIVHGARDLPGAF